MARAAVTLAVVGIGALVLGADTRYRYEWHVMVQGTRPQQWLWALLTTLWMSVAAMLLSTALGVFFGLARLSRNLILNQIAAIYVEVIRGTPLLAQIFFAYFCLSPIVGGLLESVGAPASLVGLTSEPYLIGVITLGVFAGAYVTEIVRAAVESIDHGQTEAALSQGMTMRQAYRHVVFPQALRRMTPPLAGQFVSLIKDSSLLMLLPGVIELLMRTSLLRSSTYKDREPILIVLTLYFVLCFTLSRLARRLELRLAA